MGIAHITHFSNDRKYRYTLWRDWALSESLFDRPPDRGYAQFIGLNPSTADEKQDDPTIRRCIDFAKRWGFSAFCMTNLFAWRETNPKLMLLEAEPVGVDNDHWLCEVAEYAGMTVAAWGTDGSHMLRGKAVTELMNYNGFDLHCLGKNDDGSPKHPLYLRADRQPEPYF